MFYNIHFYGRKLKLHHMKKVQNHMDWNHILPNHLNNHMMIRNYLMNLSYYLMKNYCLKKSWSPEKMSSIDVCRRSHRSKSKCQNNSRFHHYKEYNILYKRNKLFCRSKCI